MPANLQAMPSPQIYVPSGASIIPALALDFLGRMEAAGVVPNVTQRAAVAQIVRELQDIGLAKFAAVWLFIGGTAATHALDLLDAYNVTWFGGVVHNANGITGNDAGHGNTGLNPSMHLASKDDVGITVYQRTSGLTSTPENTIGCRDGVGGFEIHLHRVENLLVYRCQQNAYVSDTVLANYQGTFTMVRRGPADVEVFQNGLSVDTSTAASTALVNSVFTILAVSSSGTPLNFSDCNLALASVHKGLTAAQAADLAAAVQQFQTTLGRAV